MQQTPLHVAASSDKYEIARLLLAKGANISARGAAFLLVILPATFFFFFTFLVIVVFCNAATDALGWTPLHCAANAGKLQVRFRAA